VVGTWFGSGRFEPEEAVVTSTREWTPESMSMEGRKGTDEQVAGSDVGQVTRTGPIPGEEVGLPTGAYRCSSEGERRPRRPRLERTLRCAGEAASQSKTLEGHRATGKTEEGAGNTRYPLRRWRWRRHEKRK
jgi:hypothetical protein